MPNRERKRDRDGRADVGEQRRAQAAQDQHTDDEGRGPTYGEPSTDTDADADTDGGLAQNPLTEP